MYLLSLAMRTLATPRDVSSLQDAQRFRVTSCPWLKGRIIRWSPGGVTVKFDIPNKPWDDDHKPPDAEDPASHVGNYGGAMCVSARTEVTEA